MFQALNDTTHDVTSWNHFGASEMWDILVEETWKGIGDAVTKNGISCFPNQQQSLALSPKWRTRTILIGANLLENPNQPGTGLCASFHAKTHHYFLGVSINFVSKWKLTLALMCSWYRQNPLNPSHHRDEPGSDIEELGRLIGAGYGGLDGSWSQQIINWACWFYEVANWVEMIREACFPNHPVEIMKGDSWIDGV